MSLADSQTDATLGVRLLALVVDADGRESYRVSVRSSSDGPFVAGVMTHAQGVAWDLVLPGVSTRVTWTSPDEAFALALGHEDSADLNEVAPHWPASIRSRLVRRGLSGPGTVAFDASWFLGELATAAFDHPILLPDATSKLGLEGLERATAVLRALASVVRLRGGLAGALLGAVPGDGRLIGEFDAGELAQLGTDIDQGCRAALGTGPLKVAFSHLRPMGLGLGPLIQTEAHPDSAGRGCVVGEVDPGGAAEQAGVRTGMTLQHLSPPDLELGPSDLSFEEVLDAIDTRRAKGAPLTITFDTAAPASHLYAVEMPGAEALGAIAATVDVERPAPSRDVGVGASLDALCGDTLLWREQPPRLFVGEAGSLTCAHTDMCPQVQMAHGLLGSKLLGVATHAATPSLLAKHAASEKDEATIVPTDRPMTARAMGLLCDPDLSIALLREGDLAVFDSGALHFASNGAEALSAALYHGMITPGALPRLRLAAAAHSASAAPTEGAYSAHLFAPELLRLVEP